MNNFLILFEYIKLKIGKAGEKKGQNKKKKRKESINLSYDSNNKQETNCSSLQMAIGIINEIKGKT